MQPVSTENSSANAQHSPESFAFCDLPTLIAISAMERPASIAIVDGERRVDYATLNGMVNQVAASLQRTGLHPQESIAICSSSSYEYLAVFLGALRAGVAVAPLAPSATPTQIMDMVRDCGARILFLDESVSEAISSKQVATSMNIASIRLDAFEETSALDRWLLSAGATPSQLEIDPRWPFNIIYSSGTTGTPKGIVQSHHMRWLQVQYMPHYLYTSSTITVIATPLYSNTTMTTLLPTLAYGGCVVLMPKFEATAYLELAQKERATHGMLVPVQYQRIMALKNFGEFDLSSFVAKFCTSAPLSAAIKADIVARWPGALVEFYGMTEGGGTCMLHANVHPTKLHTVGKPIEGHDIRLIDETGREVGRGEIGEVVGRSGTMMLGYFNQPGKTSETEWFDAQGNKFIRTGDVGRFDADGFLILLDRRKDMIISGGFNIYPSDLESVMRQHPAVADVAVVGIPSIEWGETPVAYVVANETLAQSCADLLEWTNQQLGKTQRLKGLRLVRELPRNAIGKVLKRELRDSWQCTRFSGT
jgi:acyl-CoA synthetase (AMP-forming)/AMP-acid ligase II